MRLEPSCRQKYRRHSDLSISVRVPLSSRRLRYHLTEPFDCTDRVLEVQIRLDALQLHQSKATLCDYAVHACIEPWTGDVLHDRLRCCDVLRGRSHSVDRAAKVRLNAKFAYARTLDDSVTVLARDEHQRQLSIAHHLGHVAL